MYLKCKIFSTTFHALYAPKDEAISITNTRFLNQ